jgi:hypothetical protein
MNNPLLDERLDIDGLPAIVTVENKKEFVELYCHNMVIVKQKPYLDQLMCGLNHYGVSIDNYMIFNYSYHYVGPALFF